MKKSLCALMVILCLVIGGCGKEKTEYLDTSVARMEDGKMYVNCPIDDGDGDDVGYLCMIAVDRNTLLKDSKGIELKFEDFTIGDRVKIILKEPQAISKDDLSINAIEIRLVETAE